LGWAADPAIAASPRGGDAYSATTTAGFSLYPGRKAFVIIPSPIFQFKISVLKISNIKIKISSC
jgi:hypothetical protein